MRSQPNRNYVSNDDIQTPLGLARQLVAHFQPTGRVLEPCKGKGAFLRALKENSRKPRLVPGGGRVPPRGRSRGLASSANARFPATVLWCEIKQDRDFFKWADPVDWIITNPPWSQIRRFLQHGMTLADQIVFLLTINHLWTKARVRDVREAGFAIREIVLVDMPSSFPQSGFQLGAVRLSRGWTGPIALTDLQRGSTVQPLGGSGRNHDLTSSGFAFTAH